MLLWQQARFTIFPERSRLALKLWPEAGVPVLNDLGYYMHEGGHGSIPADFEIFIRFMKKHFFGE